MRQAWIDVVAVTAAAVVAGCATAESSRPKATFERAPGVLMVGLTSASANPQPQADAFAEFVERATGMPTEAAVFPDYDSLALALGRGTLDIAFVSPLAYVRAAEKGKVQALLRAVRGGRDSYRSVLFARTDGKVGSLDTLRAARELRVAWVDASSATGHIFPKALLVQNRIDPAGLFASQEFLGSHDAVCQAVLEGRADVGATFINTPDATEPQGCRAALGDEVAKLRILASTEEIPNDVLAVREGFPEELKGQLLINATALAQSDEGKATLAQVFAADGFTQVKRDDYETVRRALEVFRP